MQTIVGVQVPPLPLSHLWEYFSIAFISIDVLGLVYHFMTLQSPIANFVSCKIEFI
jgi:hypothetical protein